MANAWKIGREVRRLRQQAQAVVEPLFESRRQRLYDRDRLAHLDWSDGLVVLGSKVAILMLYQPERLAQSTLDTCAYLTAKGYATLAVSNAPLGEADRALLQERCWRVASRPNYGYDFGAYRDAILALQDWRIVADPLLILNDSVWFPLQADNDLVERLESLDADVAGTILRRRERGWRPRRPAGEIRFLESYCYRIANAVWGSAAFTAFWRAYRMTDNKYKVIRRGERDFSLAMQAAGHRVAAVLTEDDFLSEVAAFDVQDLRRTVTYGAHADDLVARERDAVLASFAPTEIWRNRALAHVHRALERGVFNSAFCYPTLKRMQAGFVKKSGERVNRLWRMRYLEAVAAGDLAAPTNAILAEMQARDASVNQPVPPPS